MKKLICMLTTLSVILCSTATVAFASSGDANLYAVDENDNYYDLSISNEGEQINSSIPSYLSTDTTERAQNNQYSVSFSSLIEEDSAVTYDSNIQYPTPRFTTSKNLTNYPVVGQENKSLCWAACIASILRYETPSQYSWITASGVADINGIGHDTGATDSRVRTILDNMLPSGYAPTYYGNSLTFQEVMTAINNNDPIYMGSFRQGIAIGEHAVIACGYYLNDATITVTIMNPGTERFELCDMTQSRPSYSYNDGTYIWNSSIRLLYN